MYYFCPKLLFALKYHNCLSFPVGFSSNSDKEAPIGVPGTSIRSVPTLTGEGINTHTCIFWIFFGSICLIFNIFGSILIRIRCHIGLELFAGLVVRKTKAHVKKIRRRRLKVWKITLLGRRHSKTLYTVNSKKISRSSR